MNFLALRRQGGIAIPLTLVLIMFILSASAIYVSLATSGAMQIKAAEYTQDTFTRAEGAVSDLLRQMAAQPELWKEMVPLEDLPAGYQEYSPFNYISDNGIPTCSGPMCHRELFPTGGGLLKNFGPLGSDGEQVDQAYSIIDQLDPDNLPTPDVTLNQRAAWVQVERLDEVSPDSDALGGNLNSNDSDATSAKTVRFRVTGTTFRDLRGKRGESTIVYVIEIPAT